MLVLDQYVLIEQTMVAKQSIISLDAAKKDTDKFKYSFKVIQKGEKCERKIEIGDNPVFSQHVQFMGVKMVERTKTKMISHIIVHENDIIAIDNDEEIEDKKEEAKIETDLHIVDN